MLILTRKLDQTIIVDGPAVIHILGIDHGQGRVKVGVTAEATTQVWRGEIAPMRVKAAS